MDDDNTNQQPETEGAEKHQDEVNEAQQKQEAKQPQHAQENEQALEAEKTEQEQKLAELEDKYRRAVADLANAHKRFQKERHRTSKLVIAAFVKKLLPLVDNMSHSLKSAQNSHDATALIEGFNLIESQMLQIFSDSGVEPIESVGERFDPEVHHAVTTEITDEVAPGTVTEELGRGFVIGDFVIRPAQVKVAAAPPAENEEKQPEKETEE